MATHPALASRVLNTPLLIEPSRAAAVLNVLSGHMGIALAGLRPAAEMPAPVSIRVERKSKEARARNSSGGGVAVIPVYGELVRRGGPDAASGLMSYAELRKNIESALQMPDVGAILLSIDSPGGEAGGVAELADFIRESTAVKPIWSIANDSAYSAAYWIGSATERFVATPNGGVGSIGVYAAHTDTSEWEKREGIKVTEITAGERKADFSPHRPLTEPAIDHLKSSVGRIYSNFTSAVAKFRGISQSDVVSTEAGLYHADAALQIGLVDGIMTLEQAVAALHMQIEGNMPQNDIERNGPEAVINPVEIAAAAAKHATEIVQICTLAGVPARAAAFLQAGTSVETVRQTLLNERAAASDSNDVDSAQPLGAGVTAPQAWATAFARANPKNPRL